jgi:tRNA (guanine37-N1)-methyltransferase
MHFAIATLFPGIFEGFLSSSLIGKARERALLSITLIPIRDFADPPHHSVDDTPYGGGPGMVMKPEPLVRAVEHAKTLCPSAKVIYLSPSGRPFTQRTAEALSREQEVILLCGRYEGIDQRVVELVVDEEISIGDYVLMGGETAAMAIIEATTRLIPSVLGNRESSSTDSFTSYGGLLEGPHYTKPREYRGLMVPDVLLSGDHRRIDAWRRDQSRHKTGRIRPELIPEDEG